MKSNKEKNKEEKETSLWKFLTFHFNNGNLNIFIDCNAN